MVTASSQCSPSQDPPATASSFGPKQGVQSKLSKHALPAHIPTPCSPFPWNPPYCLILLLLKEMACCYLEGKAHVSRMPHTPAGPARGPSPAPRPRVTIAYHIGPSAPQSQLVSGGRPPWGSQATHKSAEVGFLAWCEFLFCSHHLSWQHPNLAVLSKASSW